MMVRSKHHLLHKMRTGLKVDTAASAPGGLRQWQQNSVKYFFLIRVHNFVLQIGLDQYYDHMT